MRKTPEQRDVLFEAPCQQQHVSVGHLGHLVVRYATYDGHAQARRCLLGALGCVPPEPASAHRDQHPCRGLLAREGLEHSRQISAGGRGHRHHTRQAFDVIGASPVVPQDPASIRRPSSGFSDQVAAIGTDDQVRFSQPLECVTDTGTGALIVEDHQRRKDVSVREANSAGASSIGDGLLQASRRQMPLERVASRQGDHAPDQYLAIVHVHHR